MFKTQVELRAATAVDLFFTITRKKLRAELKHQGQVA